MYTLHLKGYAWPSVTLLYPCLFVVGTIAGWIIPTNIKQFLTQNVYFFNSKNIINIIFAYNGNLIWSIIFIYLSVMQVYIHLNNFDPLPIDIRSMAIGSNYNNNSTILNVNVNNGTERDSDTANKKRNRYKVSLIKQYIIKFLLKIVLLHITFFIIDEIFLLSGGTCSSERGTRSAEACRREKGRWEGGFDISGHFCFLMNISLILWIEISRFDNYINKESLDDIKINHKWVKNGETIIKCILYIWIFLFTITAVFYHTFMEKLLGCILGFVCPLVMYRIIPNNKVLRRILYE